MWSGKKISRKFIREKSLLTIYSELFILTVTIGSAILLTKTTQTFGILKKISFNCKANEK